MLFDTGRPEWQPLINPVCEPGLQRHRRFGARRVRRGRARGREGRLTRIDEHKLYQDIPVAVARFGKHLQFDRMVQLRWPVS